MHWEGIKQAANQADAKGPNPEACVLFLTSFTHFFEPRLDESALYDRYERWCRGDGSEPLKKRAFGLRIRERPGIKEGKADRSTRVWRGVGLCGPET